MGELQPRGGLYRIRHKDSGRVYIGCAQDIQRRWTQHLTHLHEGRHHCAALQAAWNQDGPGAFVFEVIEWNGDGRERVAREREMIRATAGTYNTRRDARAPTQRAPAVADDRELTCFWLTLTSVPFHMARATLEQWLRVRRIERELCAALGRDPLPFHADPRQDIEARLAHVADVIAAHPRAGELARRWPTLAGASPKTQAHWQEIRARVLGESEGRA